MPKLSVDELVERLRREARIADGAEAMAAMEQAASQLLTMKEALEEARIAVAADLEEAECGDDARHAAFIPVFAERLAKIDAALTSAQPISGGGDEGPRPRISYYHANDRKASPQRFVQYADDPVPAWATDVRPYSEEG